MNLIRNILAAFGLMCVVALAAGLALFGSTLTSFDPKAWAVYGKMARELARTGNPAEATVWRAKVKDGLSFEDVDTAIKSAANELNIRDVGQLPLGDQVAAMRGQPWRKLKIYLYCNPLTAANMIDFSDAYAAYLPCRVALLEDKTGKLWIYTLDMDMMIHGGRPLPGELQAEALKVKTIIQSLLDRGAKGDF